MKSRRLFEMDEIWGKIGWKVMKWMQCGWKKVEQDVKNCTNYESHTRHDNQCSNFDT